jgi:hypothetical protein
MAEQSRQDPSALEQGDLALLQDPVAQELMRSRIPATLAYIWKDGTPRAVPMACHWNGQDFVMASPPGAPKLKALPQNAKVAVTIDSEDFPYKVLMVRGTANVQMVDGVPPEYTAACRRMLGDEAGQAWSDQVGQRFQQLARIAVRPEWVGVIDFQTRFPTALA